MTREEQIRQASIEYTMENAPKCIGGDAFSEVMNGMNRNHAFEEGAKWADQNPNLQNTADCLYNEKGYPISLNGEIPTFEEAMKDAQIYNAYKEGQWIKRACKWLLDNAGKYMVVCGGGYWFNDVELVKDFKKYLEE